MNNCLLDGGKMNLYVWCTDCKKFRKVDCPTDTNSLYKMCSAYEPLEVDDETN